MREREEMMGSLPAWKLIRRLAIPTVIITLVMALYNMADIFFIGKTGDADMVNAISVCMPSFTVIQAFGTLIGAGGCTAISIALGRGESQKSRNIGFMQQFRKNANEAEQMLSRLREIVTTAE